MTIVTAHISPIHLLYKHRDNSLLDNRLEQAASFLCAFTRRYHIIQQNHNNNPVKGQNENFRKIRYFSHTTKTHILGVVGSGFTLLHCSVVY